MSTVYFFIQTTKAGSKIHLFFRFRGGCHGLNVKTSRRGGGTPVIAIATRPPARRGEAGRSEAERMVTIRCERLTSAREYEQVEIEIPQCVYNNMQTQPLTKPLARVAQRRKEGLVHKLWKIFVKE